MSDTTTEAPANGVPKYRKITLAESFKLGVWCEANRTKLEPMAHAELAKEFPGHVTGTRGRGLLRGVVVAGVPGQVTAKAREKGMLLSVAGSNVVRFAPPFIVERPQLDEAVSILRSVLAEGAGKAS